MKAALSSLFIFLNVLVFGQNALNPVSWSLSYIDKTATEGDLVIKATIDEKWHLYSQNLNPDLGPIPTSFTITASAANFETVGKPQEQGAVEVDDAMFGAKVISFEKQGLFIQKINRKSKKSFVITVTVEYMVCNDRQCLPPKTETFTITVPDYVLKGKL